MRTRGGCSGKRTDEVEKKRKEIRDKMLTPKIGTGKRLTCRPSLVKQHHST
jgi:hypothetical protein